MDIEWAGRSDADDAKRERIDAEISDTLQQFDDLDGHELMQFAFQLDPEMGKEILESKLDLYEDADLEDGFNDYLDEIYGEVKVGWNSYSTSHILKSVDPSAYRTALGEHIDGYTEVSTELGIERADWQGGDMMVKRDDWESLKVEADDLRGEIMDRRPDIRAMEEARQLTAQTFKASDSWSPSQADADALVAPSAGGRRQEATSQQSRRL